MSALGNLPMRGTAWLQKEMRFKAPCEVRQIAAASGAVLYVSLALQPQASQSPVPKAYW